MIYEERYTTVGLRDVGEYLALCRRSIVPAIRAAGGQVLCLVTGMVGDPGNAVLMMTGYKDVTAWGDAQQCFGAERNHLIDTEHVRLLRQVAYLPRGVPEPHDRRASYGYRRFFIDPISLDRFVECSEQGVWPLYHAVDCRVLGLWTPLESTFPMEILLMTGYHGPGHWEETRFFAGKPSGISDELWERGRSLGAERNSLLVRSSWVRIFRAYDIDG